MSLVSEAHPTTLLLQSTQDGDLKSVQTLIERGVSVEAGVEHGGMAPMITACMYGRLQIAQFLFARGARITGVYFERWTSPLYRACSHNHFEVVQWLVENGAYLEDVGIGGAATPLAIAVIHGHLRIVKYLIAHGADTAGLIPGRGVSLRHLCAVKGHLAMFKYLVENDIGRHPQQQQRRDGRTVDDAIKVAVRNGHVSMVQYLLLRHEADAQDVTAYLPVAIERKHVELVHLLIKYGADVNAEDDQGKTPLYYAIHSGVVDCVSVLVARGADVHQQASSYGHSAIHEMAKCGQAEMLETVARINDDEVNFDIPSVQWGELPLHLAAICGQTAVVRYLLQKLPMSSTSINALDYKRFDPLMHPSQKGHLEVVQTLVEHGALTDYSLTNSTPLILAAGQGHFDVVQYLCENGGADMNMKRGDDISSVIAAARSGHLDIVEYLLEEEQHADVGIILSSAVRTTALGEAVVRGFGDIARVLLSHNAHHFLDTEEEEIQSELLCLAVASRRIELVKLLVQSGTNVNARHSASVNGEAMEVAPLMIAVGCGNLKLVKYLCECGADVETTTDRNESPLYCAALFRRLDVVKYLVEQRNANLESADNGVHNYTPAEVAKCVAADDIEQYLLVNGASSPARESYLDFAIYDSLVSLPQDLLAQLSRREQEHIQFLVRRHALNELCEQRFPSSC